MALCRFHNASRIGGWKSERVDCAIDGVCFRNRDVPCWPKCVDWRMKAITEQDRIAARALAKNLIKQFEGMGLQRTGNSQDLIERACSILRKEAANNGISPTVLKWYVSAVRTGEI